jgi:hypothetical protein
MAKPCSICTSPNCAAIDSLLDSGESQLSVSQRFSVSKFALSRHARRLCQQPTDSIDSDEKIWLERLERAHQQAVTDGDVRGMQQTTSAALREIRARKTAKAKAAEVAPESDDGKISISSLDDVMEMFNRVPDNSVDAAKLKEALRRARALNHSDGVQIFLRMLECREFAQDLTAWVASWQPARKGDSDASTKHPMDIQTQVN